MYFYLLMNKDFIIIIITKAMLFGTAKRLLQFIIMRDQPRHYSRARVPRSVPVTYSYFQF